MEGDKIPETPFLGMLLNLPVQFVQGGQVTLEIGFIVRPVAGVRLDQCWRFLQISWASTVHR
jgi:hypothetical protein